MGSTATNRLGQGDQRGMSLVELLVAMALMLVVIAAISGLWIRLQNTYVFTSEDLTAQQEAQAAMTQMVEYIRTARAPSNPPSEALGLPIVEAEPNMITLWTDTDRDENHALELVRFYVDTDTGTLYRKLASAEPYTFPTGPGTLLVQEGQVANDVSKPLFEYTGIDGSPFPTDATGTPVVNPAEIREVQITLRIDVTRGASPKEHVLSSVVQPRNLRQY